MSRAVHFYRGLGFESVHGGEAVEFTRFLAGKSALRRESRKRLVMLGPEANQMTTSKTIAGLIGPTLVAIAAGMLLNIGSFPELAEQVSRNPALIFVSGALLFVAGLAIVRAHNRWTKEWPVLVTLLGWLAILSGLECFSQPAWPQLPAELLRPPVRSFQEPSCFWGSAPSSRSRHIDVTEHALPFQRAF
ncbi:FHIPEP family type III secretion protein [Bradyrhizobium hipponense]|uniref:FHIPEP family type III secretion protein n=1 Tax=Bradyrhizobium hipponense TaxID=2605638 RepID=A0A5S4YXV7_9BRAD|nr:FHIPEP family type III secretion protein [Bradyrhizobium hipponense]TYO68447.1 FHIPEP family type III secretion protein [Bradyrhizobium hipponense]